MTGNQITDFKGVSNAWPITLVGATSLGSGIASASYSGSISSSCSGMVTRHLSKSMLTTCSKLHYFIYRGLATLIRAFAVCSL